MPMDAPTRLLIEALHRAPVKYVLALTGGGSGAAALLLHVPGGSRTVLEVIVPYDAAALDQFLGTPPQHYCSAETARAMAVRAHARASWLAPRQAVLGVACTASLASDRPKRGEHRCYVAVHDGRRSILYSLTLAKGVRARQAEEDVVDTVILDALAMALDLSDRVPVPLLAGEHLEKSEFEIVPVPFLVLPDGLVRADAPKPTLLLPGSFNPIHIGHWALAEAAARHIGSPAAFEMSLANVDKPPLTNEQVSHRLAQFAWRAPIWLTRAPTFAEKARLFPGVTFVVGADTAARIVEPRYYGDQPVRMAEALASIHASGCRFLVAGRRDESGRFISCRDLPFPDRFRDMFAEMPDFRFDTSSTQLRSAGLS